MVLLDRVPESIARSEQIQERCIVEGNSAVLFATNYQKLLS
jgi:hypothetical protein